MARAIGKTPATTAVTEVPLEATTYTEPTSGAQRSVKSSSASDTAAGTGARTVRVTYYTLSAAGVIAGPKVETLALNGVTAVPMLATDVALVESFEMVTAGSGLVPAGTLTLATDNAGTGAIVTIAAGAQRAEMAHHYVPTGYQCEILDALVTGGDAAAANFRIKSQPFPLTAGVERDVSGAIFNANVKPEQVLMRALIVKGPARLRMYAAPANVNSQTSFGSFGYVDRRVAAF